MKTLATFFSKNLSYLILLVALLTYYSPIYWKAPTWIPALFLGFVIFFTGLSMNTSALKEIRIKKKELAITVLLKWTITVLVSVALAHLFFSSQPEIAAGVILTGAVPSATAATLYTFIAGGNISLVLASSLLDIAISPIVAPLSLIGVGTGAISISFFSLLKSFMIIVIIPITAGIALQRIFPALPHHSVHLTKLASPLSLLVVIHTLMGSGKHYMSQQLDLLPIIIIVAILQTVIPMLVNYSIARFLFEHISDARAALFQTSVNNAALAGILAFEFFGGLGAIAPILSLIINLSIGAQVSNFFAGKALKNTVQRASSYQ